LVIKIKRKTCKTSKKEATGKTVLYGNKASKWFVKYTGISAAFNWPMIHSSDGVL
jgi:hypothetical protein